MKLLDTTLEDLSNQVAEGLPPVFAPGAGYDLHQIGQREQEDLIVLP
jgi:hypothetical protein